MYPSKNTCPLARSDWPDLPADLIDTIARLLTSMIDFLAFRGVCKSWRSAATVDNFDTSIPQLPWLMFMSTDENLVTNPDGCKKTIKFMDLFNNRRVFNTTMQYELGTKFFSSGGWLLGVKEDTINLELIHVIRGTRLGLPGLDTFPGFEMWYLHDRHDYSYFIDLDNFPEMEVCRPRCFIKKMVLSSLPGTTGDLHNNFVVVVIWGDQNQLAFSRPGESRWTVFDSWDESFSDVICHNGIVYALDFHRRIVSCDIHGEVPTKLQLLFSRHAGPFKFTRCYLVVDSSSGKFIIVIYPHDLMMPSLYFQMFECDLSGGNGVEQIREIGNKALFLGFNSSMCLQVPAPDASASLKPNSRPRVIYLTDWNVYTHLYTHVYHLHKNQTGIYYSRGSDDVPYDDCMPYGASGEAYVAPLLWVLPGL